MLDKYTRYLDQEIKTIEKSLSPEVMALIEKRATLIEAREKYLSLNMPLESGVKTMPRNTKTRRTILEFLKQNADGLSAQQIQELDKQMSIKTIYATLSRETIAENIIRTGDKGDYIYFHPANCKDLSEHGSSETLNDLNSGVEGTTEMLRRQQSKASNVGTQQM